MAVKKTQAEKNEEDKNTQLKHRSRENRTPIHLRRVLDADGSGRGNGCRDVARGTVGL